MQSPRATPPRLTTPRATASLTPRSPRNGPSTPRDLTPRGDSGTPRKEKDKDKKNLPRPATSAPDFHKHATTRNMYSQEGWLVGKIIRDQDQVYSGPQNLVYPLIEYPRFSCTTTSLYPWYPGNKTREGDPVCDSYFLRMWTNAGLVCITDGCNWGKRPLEAATRAKEAFTANLLDWMRVGLFKTHAEASPRLVTALAAAHDSILQGKSEWWMAGTTTLLGGLVLPIDDPAVLHKWVFIGINIGDCKVLLIDRNGKSFDMTKGNRQNVADAQDPGGRVGPHQAGGPDLRNMEIVSFPCREGDTLLFLTDGVHDNLDPQTLGKKPRDFGLEGAEWNDIDHDTGTQVKTVRPSDDKTSLLSESFLWSASTPKYMTDLLMNLTMKNGKVMSPQNIVSQLMRYCLDVTSTSRQFMEQNPKLPLIHDYVGFPGKMDHATCVALRVGIFDPQAEVLLVETETSPNPEIWPFL